MDYPTIYLLVGIVVFAIVAIAYAVQNSNLRDSRDFYKGVAADSDKRTMSEIDAHRRTTTSLNTLRAGRDDMQVELNKHGQAEADTNTRLYDAGKRLAALQTALRAQRNAGNVGPKQRQELKDAVDNALAALADTLPKKVGITPTSGTSNTTPGGMSAQLSKKA